MLELLPSRRVLPDKGAIHDPESANRRPFAVALLATPIGIFAIYISWLIVPVIVETVVPAVVRAVVEK